MLIHIFYSKDKDTVLRTSDGTPITEMDSRKADRLLKSFNGDVRMFILEEKELDKWVRLLESKIKEGDEELNHISTVRDGTW